jgi:hypothetical protein
MKGRDVRVAPGSYRVGGSLIGGSTPAGTFRRFAYCGELTGLFGHVSTISTVGLRGDRWFMHREVTVEQSSWFDRKTIASDVIKSCACRNLAVTRTESSRAASFTSTSSGPVTAPSR